MSTPRPSVAAAHRAAPSRSPRRARAFRHARPRHNVTRFAVIGGQEPHRTGRDKTALMFEIPHKPGALADAMLIFKRGRLNLTWIESFPMPNSKNEYLFFVELEGHQSDSRVKKALQALNRKTSRLEVLGSYARSEPVA